MGRFLKLHDRWIAYIMLVGFTLLAVMLFHSSLKVSKIPTLVYSLRLDEEAYNLVQLQSDDIITQEFQSNSDFGIVSLQFKVTDKVEGYTDIKIIDSDGSDVIFEEHINNSDIKKTGLCNLNLDNSDSGKANTIYKISLESKNEKSETTGISVYLANTHNYSGKMTINSKQVDSILNLGTCRYSAKLVYVYWVIIVLSILALATVGYAIIIRKCDIEKIFVMAAISFGIVYIIMFPSDGLCDSSYHYEQIYKYSNSVLSILDKNIPDDSNDLYMRQSDYEAYIRCVSDRSDDTDGNDFLNIVKNFSMLSSDNTMVNVTLKNGENGFIHYIPQIITMVLGRCINLGAVPIMYLIRLVGLLIFAFVTSWAIKVTPVGKEIFVAVGLLPTCLEQVTGFSYDTIIVPVVLLFIAYWLLYMYGDDKHLSKNVYAVIVVLAFLIGACKGGLYGFAVLLIFTVPKDRLKLKNKFVVLGIAILAVVISYGSYVVAIGSQMHNDIIATESNYVQDVNTEISTENVNDIENVTMKTDDIGSVYGNSYIINQPIKFIGVIIGSVIESPQVFFGSMIGTHLQTSRLMADMAIVIPFVVIMMILCAIDEVDITIVDRKYKIVIVAMLIFFCLFLGFLMLAETPKGWNMQGFNGRYFIPFIPLILLLFRENGIVVKKAKKRKLILSLSIWEVMMVFYLITYMLSK